MTQPRLSFLLPLLAFIILAAVGAFALYGTLTGSRTPDQLPSVLIGKQAPQTPLPSLDQSGSGAPVDLGRFRGAPVLVNFFASWCAPCRAEAPALEMLSDRVKIVGIAYKDRANDTMSFLEQYGNPFAAIAMDVDGRTGIEWGVYGVPETYVIDADGTVKYRHAGPLTREVIDQRLMPLIEGGDS